VGILRLSHVEVRVPDLELATAYYTEVLGLLEVAREPERVYLKCWDEHDHHSVILRFAPRHGLERMAFKVERADDLATLETRVERLGGAVKRLDGSPDLGGGRAIRFEAPSGHEVDLVHGMEKTGNLLPKTNPPPAPQGLTGIHPPRIDHVFVTAEDVRGATAFYTEALGFRMTERLVTQDGHLLGAWLERSHSPHDLAVITGPNGGLHHFAFWVDDWSDVRRAADILAYHGVQIDVGPTRHGITRGYTVYFFDPVGNRNEVFTGGYWVDPDAEPVTWTEEEMGRAIFYYQGALDPRFLTVHS